MGVKRLFGVSTKRLPLGCIIFYSQEEMVCELHERNLVILRTT